MYIDMDEIKNLVVYDGSMVGNSVKLSINYFGIKAWFFEKVNLR